MMQMDGPPTLLDPARVLVSTHTDPAEIRLSFSRPTRISNAILLDGGYAIDGSVAVISLPYGDSERQRAAYAALVGFLVEYGYGVDFVMGDGQA